MVKTVNKAAVKELIQGSSKYYLIDVRSASEAASNMPLLPTAINIPLGELAQAFSLADGDFQSRYSVAKPSSDDKIVVYCMSGARAGSAASSLANKGYEK